MKPHCVATSTPTAWPASSTTGCWCTNRARTDGRHQSPGRITDPRLARPVFTGALPAGDAGAGRGPGAGAAAACVSYRTRGSGIPSADAAGGERKNISLDPATGRLGNTSLPPDAAARLAQMIDRFGHSAERAPSPPPPPRCVPDPPDAGAASVQQYRRGRRARAWRVGEPFPDYARRCRAARGCCRSWASPRGGAALGPYHAAAARCREAGCGVSGGGSKADVTFPAGTTWLCFTDQVLHAALAGHCALEQTFHLPVAAMAEPARAPLSVLEQLAGRRLA